MYRSVGDDTNTALFTDDYMSQATQVTHAPLMRDPVKRTVQAVTAPAPAPAATDPSVAYDARTRERSAVYMGLIGVVVVGGLFFLVHSRKG